MAILIGGSPSTGSSLLRRMLNRHSAIFCGSETSLFAKAQLYQDWNAHKAKLLRPSHFGLSNAGWHNFIGLTLEPEYGYDRKQIRTLIKAKHDDFAAFIENFYNPILLNYNKKLWAEKTPSNAFTLDLFLAQFQHGKVVHITRGPLDVIASLTNRGLSTYNAAAVYLLNTSKALMSETNERYHILKYNDLILQPEDTLSTLCLFLELNYEKGMLEPQKGESGTTQMKGWKSDETAFVSPKSIGRFAELPMKQKNEIINYCHLLKSNLETPHNSIPELAIHLGYALPDPKPLKSSALRHRIQKEIKEDIKKRAFSRFYFRGPNYPIYLDNKDNLKASYTNE